MSDMRVFPGTTSRPGCVVAVLVAVLVIGAVNLVLVSVKYASYKHAPPAEVRPLVCVACQHLEKAFAHDQELTVSINSWPREHRGGVQTCCARDSNQMSVIIELIRHKQTNVRVPETYDPADITPGQVSVHKRLLPYTNHNTTSGRAQQFSNDITTPLQLDNSSDPLREHAHNVRVLPSGFLILLSGYYHVYSSLEFKAHENIPCREYAVKTWKQIVVRSRPNDRTRSGAILSSAHTCCDNCTWDKETSYTGGTFYLRAGDHLHTEVSGTGLVTFRAESSYFGLTMIGDTDIRPASTS